MPPRTGAARWHVGVAAVTLAVLSQGIWAAVCSTTGLEESADVTLMASPKNPASAAWVVGPKCPKTDDIVELTGQDIERLVLPDNVKRVASVPSKMIRFIQVDNLSLKSADLSAAANAEEMSLSSALSSVNAVNFPKQIESIYLRKNSITSLKGAKFPAALQKLWLSDNQITTIDLVYPAQLISLELDNNPIAKLDRVTFPKPLQDLYLENCGITVIRGVTWPTTLRNLVVTGNPIVNFEIRQSDVEIFSKLNAFDGTISQTKCSDKNGILQTIKGKSVCVITDDHFDELYGSQATSPTSAPVDSKSSSGGSKGGGTAGSAGSSGGAGAGTGGQTSSGSKSNSTTASFNSSGETGTTKEPIDSDGDGVIDTTTSPSSDGEAGSVPGTPSSRKTQAPGTSTGSSDGTIDGSVPAPSSSTTVVIVSSSAGGVFVLLALVFTCRKRGAAKTQNDKDDPYVDGKTPSGAPTNSDGSKDASDAPSQEYVANDVRNDRLLLGFRVELKDITVEDEPIARGGYGVIYRGRFLDRAIVMKQMIPGLWRDESALTSFMDEIRLCASLDHPKIASFVGIVWSSLRDLSVVIEYMPGGDLHAVLRDQSVPASPHDWLEPWASAKLNPKKKIAQDIVEAVVYLHSFNSPILHRDLKAKNVLLDSAGNAKLSDFGISRELSVDQTMTREVGTTAWIAPEVLRGDRYSEKADIYSLGVILVEMDCCRHPYADHGRVQMRKRMNTSMDPDQVPATMSDLAHKNTQIALLVSTGKLRPAVTSACPEAVATLVERCVHFDANERPTAMEVYYELRQIGKNSSSQQ